MAAPSYPLMRGKAVDWSSIEIAINTLDGKSVPPVKGITGLDWGIDRSGEYQYGTSANPIRQRRGRISYSATLKILKEEWQFIKATIGNGYLEREMNIVGSWIEGSFESKVSIQGATIKSEKESTSEDGSPEITIELLPMKVIEDGIEPLL
jgi:hypothetical protein